MDETSALLRERFPDFVSTGKPLRGRKSCVIAGSYRGTPAVAKVLVRAEPIWRFCFERELEIYALFQKESPPFVVPTLLAIDREADVILTSRLVGSPLSTKRSCDKTIAAAASHALCEAVDRLRAYTRGLDLSSQSPSRNVVRAMRARLLEDPIEPLAFMRDGVARCVRWGLITKHQEELITRGLASDRLVFGHGDLLPRNIICDGESVGIVDWECAGACAEDWDRALLWVGLPTLRPALEEGLPPRCSRYTAFLSAVAFALLRELRFLQHFRGGAASKRALTLRAELQHILARLKLG